MNEFTTNAKAIKEVGVAYLGGVSTSAKISHSQEYSHQYTYAIYLAPYNTSGYNTCSHSTPECRLGCIFHTGRAKIEDYFGATTIKDARIKKTKLFYEQTEYFMNWLIADIKRYRAKAERDGFFFSVRLNATSDIDWAKVLINGKNIFEIFPDVAFYDYTKNHNKFDYNPKNYHLTLSYTGRNWTECKAKLQQGNNVAMVFNVKHERDLPAMYKGYKVINGDLTDYRIDDAKGIIVGLKYKAIANKVAEKKLLKSCFVVTPKVETETTINVRELELV